MLRDSIKILFVFLIILILAGYNFIGCGGCPEGHHQYNGECVQDSNNNIDGDYEIPEYQVDDLVLPSEVLEKNNIDFDASGLYSGETYTFDVPEGVTSMIIWAMGNEDDFILPLTIHSPSNELIYDLNVDVDNGYIGDNYDFQYYFDFNTSLFLPNTPKVDFESGEWKIDLGSLYANNKIFIRTFFSYETHEEEKEPLLNVNIWPVGIDVANSDGELKEEFQESLQVFKDLYTTAGITIGDVEIQNLTEDEIKQYGVINSLDEFYEMFLITEKVQNDYPNIFLINGFDADGLEGVLGISSHIPGPPGVKGTKHSGVAVSMQYYENYPRITGYTMAHELGHWLGLFHTSEATGRFFDPLDDTKECSHLNDSNGDRYVDPLECSNLDASNVMFWMVPFEDDFLIGDDGQNFSMDQEWVLHRNPIMNFQ